MSSLRRRLAVALVAGQLVLLGAGTWAAHRAGTRALERQFDEALVRQVSTLASQLEQRGNHVGVELDETFMAEYFSEEDPHYFELFYGGVPFGRSPALGEDDLTHRDGPREAPALWNEPLPDGRAGRYVGMETEVPEVERDRETGELPEAATVTIVLARSRAELDEQAGLFLLGLLVGATLLLLVALAIVWVTVQLSLRPVHAFARQVAEVDAHTLGVPLDPERVPAELRPVVAGVNQLLERLDRALRAERRTASNLAHELLTPISELRAMSEVALQEGSDPAYRDRALGAAHEISVQMAKLIRMVRQLTAVDAPSHALPGEPVPLGPLVERVVAGHETRAKEKGLQLAVDVNGEILDCDREALLSVFNNLVGNAVEYCPEGGRVELRADRRADRVRLSVHNECDGLAEEHLVHLTEPFWRLSSARSERGHHGLGLTIAQGMAVLAGLELRFTLDGARFTAETEGPSAA